MLSLWFYRLLAGVIPLIPAAILDQVATIVGGALSLLPTRTRRQLGINLDHLLATETPAATRRALIRRVFSNAVANYFSLFRLKRLRLTDLEKQLTIHGWSYFANAFAEGRGVILTSTHFGAPDLVAQVLAARGFPVTGPVERLSPPALFDLINNLRQSHGLRLLPVDEPGTLRALLKALKAGEVVGVLADRDVTGSGREVTFCGRPARLPDGHVRLARRTGAPIILAFNVRRPDGHFDVWVEPPLRVATTADPEKDIVEAMRVILTTVERYLRRYPDQWVYFQPVWIA